MKHHEEIIYDYLYYRFLLGGQNSVDLNNIGLAFFLGLSTKLMLY